MIEYEDQKIHRKTFVLQVFVSESVKYTFEVTFSMGWLFPVSLPYILVNFTPCTVVSSVKHQRIFCIPASGLGAHKSFVRCWMERGRIERGPLWSWSYWSPCALICGRKLIHHIVCFLWDFVPRAGRTGLYNGGVNVRRTSEARILNSSWILETVWFEDVYSCWMAAAKWIMAF